MGFGDRDDRVFGSLLRSIAPALVIGLLLIGCWLSVGARRPIRESGPDEPKIDLLAIQSVELGEFDVVSGQIAITDPSYGKSYIGPDGISKLVRTARKGKWRGRAIIYVVGNKDHTVCAELLAFPADHPLPESPSWEELSGCIGVDTGKAGFFDLQFIDSEAVVPKNFPWKDGKADPERLWYSYCCEITLGKPGAGVIPYGVVSSSGYGDGGYPVAVLRNDRGIVVGLRLVFDRIDHYDLSKLKLQPKVK